MIFPENKKMVILRGAPHSGKSYHASLHFPKAFVISSDHAFLLPDDKIRYDYKKEGASHRAVRLEAIAACQANEKTIVIDDFNIFRKDIQYYTTLAQAYGYELEIVRFQSNPKISCQFNWRRFDHHQCRSMESFLAKQPLISGEKLMIPFNYQPVARKTRGQFVQSTVKVRRKK